MVIPQTDEYLVYAISEHWIKYAVPVVLYAVLTPLSIGMLALAGATAHRNDVVSFSSHFIGLAMLLLTHHWFFHRILSESIIDIIVTTKRIIYLEDSLFLSYTKHDIALERIRAVEARENGIVQNILSYGDLWFDTGGSDITGGTVIHYVPHPHTQEKQIMKLLEMK